MAMHATPPDTVLHVQDLTMAYGDHVVMKDLTFSIGRGDIFIVMGGSGSGKSTLMRHMVGLEEPARGKVLYGDVNFTASSPEERDVLIRRVGVMYQGGALFSSLTLAENVALPLEQYTGLTPSQIQANVAYKLGLVGLGSFGDHYPAQISGGMKKRAAIARAMALDPEILFLDEPSAGLDPLSSARLDALLQELQQQLRTTLVIVTHELASIFAIGTNSVYLDARARTLGAAGNPRELRDHCPDPVIRAFLNRESAAEAGATGGTGS